jgi:Flp pilus assembly protein CpaB
MASKEVTMLRGALLAAGVAAVAIFAAGTTPSETAAAPKRHQETQYYTITLTDSRLAPRGPRLKAKPQTGTAGKHFQGFVSRFSAGPRK